MTLMLQRCFVGRLAEAFFFPKTWQHFMHWWYIFYHSFIYSLHYKPNGSESKNYIFPATLMCLDYPYPKTDFNRNVFEYVSLRFVQKTADQDSKKRTFFTRWHRCLIRFYFTSQVNNDSSVAVCAFCYMSGHRYLVWRVRKISKRDYELRHVSVCPSVHMEQLGSHWTYFHEIWTCFDNLSRKYVTLTFWRRNFFFNFSTFCI